MTVNQHIVDVLSSLVRVREDGEENQNKEKLTQSFTLTPVFPLDSLCKL